MSAKTWAVAVTSCEVTRLQARATQQRPMPPVAWQPNGHATLLADERHRWALEHVLLWRGLTP